MPNEAFLEGWEPNRSSYLGNYVFAYDQVYFFMVKILKHANFYFSHSYKPKASNQDSFCIVILFLIPSKILGNIAP